MTTSHWCLRQKSSGQFYITVKGWLSQGLEFPYWAGVGRVWEEKGVTPWKASTKLYQYSEHSSLYGRVEGAACSVCATQGLLPGIFAPPVREDLQGFSILSSSPVSKAQPKRKHLWLLYVWKHLSGMFSKQGLNHSLNLFKEHVQPGITFCCYFQTGQI